MLRSPALRSTRSVPQRSLWLTLTGWSASAWAKWMRRKRRGRSLTVLREQAQFCSPFKPHPSWWINPRCSPGLRQPHSRTRMQCGRSFSRRRGKPEPRKHVVHALVEPGGHLLASQVPDVWAKTLRSVLEKHADKRSALHTDDGLEICPLGRDFAEHKTVNHSADEYYKDGAGVQSAESYFALLKRVVMGSFHSAQSSTCSAIMTSSPSDGTTDRPSAWRTRSAPAAWSRMQSVGA